MNKSRTLVSTFTSLEDEFRADHLKLCFLWYDEVVIETIGSYQKQNFVESLLTKDNLNKNDLKIFTDIVLPLEQCVSKELLDIYESSREYSYPRWGKNCENFTYPKPENAEQYAHNVLLTHIQKDWGIETPDWADMQHIEGSARAAVESVKLWDTINREMPCMLQADNYEKIAMIAARRFNLEEPLEIEPFRLFEMIVPALDVVEWSHIIRIKERGNFDKLRKKLADVISRSAGDYYDAQHELLKREENAVSEIIEQYRPNVKKVAIESAISNIPCIPILNPVSAFFGARDIRNELRKAEELNWFYLLRDIKQLGS